MPRRPEITRDRIEYEMRKHPQWTEETAIAYLENLDEGVAVEDALERLGLNRPQIEGD